MSPADPWQPAVAGMELRRGAEIRTGLRSAVRCGIPPDQTFTLDRLGTIEITQAIKTGNLVKTDLTMKYGRTQYRIQKAGLDHEAAISSPGASLAVRGTTVELEDMPPFKPRAVSYTGRASFQSERRVATVGTPGGAKAAIESGSSSAAYAALLASVTDPQTAPARTPADARLIQQQVSLGAVARFDRTNNITVIQGGPGPTRTEADLLPTLPGGPGGLDIVARWTGNADINLSVAVYYGDPSKLLFGNPNRTADEFIYPGFGLDQSRSGGRTDFDHRGGANGGHEIVYWKKPLTSATYSIIVDRVSGDPTPVTVNLFKAGTKLDMYSNFFEGTGPTTVTPTLTTQNIDLGDGLQFSYREGRSSTFTFNLETSKIGRFATTVVYDPVTSAPSVSALPDLNNGAPADLPAASTTTPQIAQTQSQVNAKLAVKAATVRPVTGSQVRNLMAGRTLGTSSNQLRTGNVSSPAMGPKLGN
jgi:hypothetical protein